MINIDATLFVQMVNFFILLFAMNIILYRPIRRLVAQRNEHISEQEQQISQADAEAVAAGQEFEDRIQAARDLGRRKVQDLKDAAYQYEKDLLQKAGEQAGEKVQEMRSKVQAEIGAAREQLRSQVQAFAMDLAQKILGRSI
ncbi:ATP synthase F0 subunit B [Desulfoferrobacter suflitae]|uniref:ATP synthase F0 subunit B n=1 Tax=Desulfoferrobacter suflitae TaxID=2865782 RepID=UPI0021640B5E|nr:ATP synthase F0 subunit B [Desulfoferrobacter suflitae]MCK8601133.1 ATP synthase F0 subunit B [Desulfoferrobacter suflitae]